MAETGNQPETPADPAAVATQLERELGINGTSRGAAADASPRSSTDASPRAATDASPKYSSDELSPAEESARSQRIADAIAQLMQRERVEGPDQFAILIGIGVTGMAHCGVDEDTLLTSVRQAYRAARK